MSKTLLEIIDTKGCPNILGKETKAGGSRKNAGRKKGEPKKAVGVRVLIRFLEQCKQAARNEEQRLLELERQNGL